MWRPDKSVVGPERATRRDVDELNHVFSDAFTERYRRDGLSGVRVPFLNPAVWQFAIDAAADGAMVWRDSHGELIAFNVAHRSGTEGWMGPLAVRTDRQGQGIGRRIVMEAIALLDARGAQTIGLETMPRTIENIGFYSRVGFVPGHLTVTLQREVTRRDLPADRLGGVPGDDRAAAIGECRRLADEVVAGVDFTRELELTLEHALGDATLVRDGAGRLAGFALWHTTPLAYNRAKDELRILKLAARDAATAAAVIEAVDAEAGRAGMARITVRCQTSHPALYADLLQRGFRVHWTDLRMTLNGKGEGERRGVLLSNWEI